MLRGSKQCVLQERHAAFTRRGSSAWKRICSATMPGNTSQDQVQFYYLHNASMMPILSHAWNFCQCAASLDVRAVQIRVANCVL